MTIYVDDFGLEATVTDDGTGRKYTSAWSHMVTDGPIEELHAFAARVGLQRRWFQDKIGTPHYDVTKAMRAKAVRLGAVEVTLREASDILRRARGE